MYLVARNVSKERFIGATGFLFLAGVLPHRHGSIGGRYPNRPRVVKSSLALIVVLIGFRIGEMLRHRVGQELFRKAVLMAFFSWACA